jgi:hypothetical protein
LTEFLTAFATKRKKTICRWVSARHPELASFSVWNQDHRLPPGTFSLLSGDPLNLGSQSLKRSGFVVLNSLVTPARAGMVPLESGTNHPEHRNQPMPPILRNTLALIAGIFVGCLVNLGIVTLGSQLIPAPDGVDMSDMEQFAENLKLLTPIHFLSPWLAHAVGTLAGAFTAARIAVSHKMKLGLGVGTFFLLGGITMLAMVGGPVWFAVLDLAGAYLPMAYLGGRWGRSQAKLPV